MPLDDLNVTMCNKDPELEVDSIFTVIVLRSTTCEIEL